MQGYRDIKLDFPIDPAPRYGYGRPAHARLHEILAECRTSFSRTLRSFLDYTPDLVNIDVEAPASLVEPFWANDSFPGLDAAALYCLTSQSNPRRLVEIGSGNSTKFIRRAISDQDLRTQTTVIDPYAAAFIDRIADTVVREPLEATDLRVFSLLGEDDIVFLDGSHRCFENSDATAFFMDVMPELRPGILVQIHDIFLPDSYPPAWKEWFYSEQYLLAAYLLGGSRHADILLPNYFICKDVELSGVLDPLWDDPRMAGVHRHGGSFWLRTK